MRLLRPNLNRRPFFTPSEEEYLFKGLLILTGITLANAAFTCIYPYFQ